MKRINQLFFMRPWAVKEGLLQPMAEIIDRHIQGVKLSQEEIEARTGGKKAAPPDYEVANGVARVPVQGVIAKRASMINGISQPRGTSVEEIKRNFRAALKDPEVREIALDIDSPGGSVDGIAELSDLIFEGRKKKPVSAYADGQMCSAAYWIGSAANKIYSTRSSEVGSIGVYAVVRDFTVMQHNEGIKTEVIRAGKHKAAGHPERPLTEEDKGVIQEEINAYYDLFVQAVARNRGVSLEKAGAMADGRVFIGARALDSGLIDGIASLEDAFPGEGGASARSESTPPLAAEKDPGITGATAKETEQQTEDDMLGKELKAVTLEDLKTDRADLCTALIEEGRRLAEAAHSSALNEACQSAAAAERGRILAIQEKAKAMGGVEAAALEAITAGDDVPAAESRLNAAKLAALQAAAPAAKGGGNAAGEETILGGEVSLEDQCKAIWDKNAEFEGKPVKAHFSSLTSFVSYQRAKKGGLVRN